MEGCKKTCVIQKSLTVYLIVNSFLWAVWFFGGMNFSQGLIPWPAWCSIGWGIAIVFQYFDAYVFHDKVDAVEKEYNKIKLNKNRP